MNTRPPKLLDGSEEGFAEKLNDALNLSRLATEHNQHVHSSDWTNFAEAYADARLGLQARCVAKGVQHPFRLMLFHEAVRPIRLMHELVHMPIAYAEAVGRGSANFDEIFPMLIAVGDLVDGPKNIISSRMWLLGENELPLLRREFLLYTPMTGRWEWLWFPCGFIKAPEGKMDAGHSTSIGSDHRNSHFVESVAELHDDLTDLERDFASVGRRLIDACNYVSEPLVTLGAEGQLTVSRDVVDHFGQFDQLSLSVFDLGQ